MEFEFNQTRNCSAIIAISILTFMLTFMEYLLIKTSLSNAKVSFVEIIFGIYLLSVYRIFFWALFGREHVKITSEELVILKKGTFLTKPKLYKFKEIKNPRIESRKHSFSDFLVSRRSLTSLETFGCVVFEYENKTVNFGGNIAHAEAENIVELMKIKVNAKK